MESSPQADVQKLQELVKKLEEQNDRIRSQQQQQQQLSPTVKFAPPQESSPPSVAASSTANASGSRLRRISVHDWDLDPAAIGGDDEQWLFRSVVNNANNSSLGTGHRALTTMDWLAADDDGFCSGQLTPSSSSDGGRQPHQRRGLGSGSSLLAKLNELALIGRLAPAASPAATTPTGVSSAGFEELAGQPGESYQSRVGSSLYRQLNNAQTVPSSNGYGSNSNLSVNASVDSRTFRRPHARGISAGGALGSGAAAFDDSMDGGAGGASSQDRLHDLTDVQIVAKMQIDALRQQVTRSRSQLSIASSSGSQDDLLAASNPLQQQQLQLQHPGLHHSAPESAHQRQRRALPARPAQQQQQQLHQRPSSAMGQAYRGNSPSAMQQQQALLHSNLTSRPASVTPVLAQQRSSMLPRPNQPGGALPTPSGSRRASSGQMGLPRPVQQQQGRIPSPLRGSSGPRSSVDHGSAGLNGGGGFGYHGQR